VQPDGVISGHADENGNSSAGSGGGLLCHVFFSTIAEAETTCGSTAKNINYLQGDGETDPSCFGIPELLRHHQWRGPVRAQDRRDARKEPSKEERNIVPDHQRASLREIGQAARAIAAAASSQAVLWVRAADNSGRRVKESHNNNQKTGGETGELICGRGSKRAVTAEGRRQCIGAAVAVMWIVV